MSFTSCRSEEKACRAKKESVTFMEGRTVSYKSCHIRLTSFQRTKDGPWIPNVNLTCSTGESQGRAFPLEFTAATFQTQDEANTYALKMAKVWIDKNL
jgi:hypothetical protein